MYLDANNLYGWAMSQYLPTGNFRWMKQQHIDNLDLAKYREDSKTGIILEVDLKYKIAGDDTEKRVEKWCQAETGKVSSEKTSEKTSQYMKMRIRTEITKKY